MTLLDTHAFNEQKMDRIQAMLEQIVLDTVLSVLDKITEKNDQAPQCVCYKSDCLMRDNIPF